MALARPIERAAVRAAAEERRRLLFIPPDASRGGSSGAASGAFGSGRPTTGDWVEVVSGEYAGRRGELIQDDHDHTPYKMRFEDDESTSRFLKEKAVRRAARPVERSLHVVGVVLRGQTYGDSLSSLPHTLGLMRELHASGRYSLSSFSRYAATTADSRRSLRTLFHGGGASGGEEGAADDARGGSVWDVYRRWGYVSAYVDGECDTAAAEAADASLADSPATARGADHVLLEPFCELDTQLRHQLRRFGNISQLHATRAATAGGGRRRRRNSCAERQSHEARSRGVALDYLRSYLLTAYRNLPKLALAVLPAPRSRLPRLSGASAGGDQANRSAHDARDKPLGALLRRLLDESPRTAVLLLSDGAVPHSADASAAVDGAATSMAAAQPMLHVLLPVNATSLAARRAVEGNARLPASVVDVHATLRQVRPNGHRRGVSHTRA